MVGCITVTPHLVLDIENVLGKDYLINRLLSGCKIGRPNMTSKAPLEVKEKLTFKAFR